MELLVLYIKSNSMGYFGNGTYFKFFLNSCIVMVTALLNIPVVMYKKMFQTAMI